MRRKLSFLAVIAGSVLVLTGCPPAAPIFRMASNGPDWKTPCEQCKQMKTGLVYCSNISSFYVFFGPPVGRTIASAVITIEWNKKTPSGFQVVKGTVANADVFNYSNAVCGNQGWGAHIVPSNILAGFQLNAADNSFVVNVTVLYVGQSDYSAPMRWVIYFLG